MFTRHSKGQRKNENIKFFKAAVLNTDAILVYEDQICAIGRMNEETDKAYKWDIAIAEVEGYDRKTIERKFKNLIGSAYRWSNLPKKKKLYCPHDYGQEITKLSPTIKFL